MRYPFGACYHLPQSYEKVYKPLTRLKVQGLKHHPCTSIYMRARARNTPENRHGRQGRRTKEQAYPKETHMGIKFFLSQYQVLTLKVETNQNFCFGE